MADIRFYHLQKHPLKQVLPGLVTKALEGNYKILIRALNKEQMRTIDKGLWIWRPESFIPHGTDEDSEEIAARHPVLLTSGDIKTPVNSATLLIDLALSECEIPENYERCCFMFEDWEDQLKTAARQRWKTLNEADIHKLSYWQLSDQAGWEQKS